MTILGKAKKTKNPATMTLCPCCKRNYLKFSKEDGMFDKAGEAYCANCGHITNSLL